MPDLVLWRRLDLPGHEVCALAAVPGGWTLAGTAVFAHDRQPCRLDYHVRCDADWRTVAATVEGVAGPRRIDLRVTAEEGRWRLNGADCPAVDGCVDLDLGFSPSTNLLPIRRLALAVGEEAAVRAAWLPFPALAFEPLAQGYRREGEATYRYTSAGGAFVRTLEVNGAGLVTRYPGLWEAEAVL